MGFRSFRRVGSSIAAAARLSLYTRQNDVVDRQREHVKAFNLFNLFTTLLTFPHLHVRSLFHIFDDILGALSSYGSIFPYYANNLFM